jgi:hypothetical protein
MMTNIKKDLSKSQKFVYSESKGASFLPITPINCGYQAEANNMRTVRELLSKHKSFYAAFKALGLRQSGQFKRWHELDAKVDYNGQIWIKTGKPIEGWKR